MAATAALEVASAGNPAFATMRALAQSQTLARTRSRGPWCSARSVFAFSRMVGMPDSSRNERNRAYLFLRSSGTRLVPGADDRAEAAAQVRAGRGGGDGQPEMHQLVLLGGHRVA